MVTTTAIFDAFFMLLLSDGGDFKVSCMNSKFQHIQLGSLKELHWCLITSAYKLAHPESQSVPVFLVELGDMDMQMQYLQVLEIHSILYQLPYKLRLLRSHP